jgi:hypothetical protein
MLSLLRDLENNMNTWLAFKLGSIDCCGIADNADYGAIGAG